MIFKLSLDLPEDADLIGTARHLSRTLLSDIAVIQSDIEDVETIVDELCTNVIRHSQSHSAHYGVLLEFFKPSVVITVTDKGKGFAPHDIKPIGEWRPDLDGGERIGGFGLPLVEGMTERLSFTATDPHGTTVRAEKSLHYESEAAADKASERDKKSTGAATVSAE